MNKSIKIKVTGIHEIDGEKEKYITDTEGEYYLKNDKHYFRYEEETPYGTAKAMIKVSKDSLEVIKSGAVNMRLSLEVGKLIAGMYDTPYGSIPIDVNTKSIDVYEENNQIKVVASYKMMNNESVIASCELIIDARD
jgi:uncharacterized beta-barrel protein YwiB (DUF1934 family)